MPAIRAVGPDDLDALLRYLRDSVGDNGEGATPLFMPVPRGVSAMTPDRVASFRDGIARAVGEPGWRRIWTARDAASDEILGHVDLRAQASPYSAHRAWLGMGVHRAHRGQGLGRLLLEYAMAQAAAMPGLEWVDLQVLAGNVAARRLYERARFVVTGEVADVFRIDGAKVGEVSMTRAVRRGDMV